MGTFRTIRLLASSMLLAVPCAAQSLASVAINAGAATDVTGAGSSAVTIAPSLTRLAPQGSSTISASATRFANDAWSAGASLGMNGRASSGAFTPVIDVSALAATTSYDFSYAVAELVPSLEAKAGSMKLFAGARLAAAGTSSILNAPTGTSPFGPLPGGERSTNGRSARTLVAGFTTTSVSQGGEVATFGYRGEAGIVAGTRQTDHTASASVANSKFGLVGSVGHRNTPIESMVFGSATLGVAIAPAVTMQLAAGNYPSNPMLGTASGQFVNVGLVMKVGRGRGATLPNPSGVDSPRKGTTRVAIKAGDASRVELAGDFTKWQLVRTTRAANGVWYVDLSLPPGEYRYAFRIDGNEWRVPEGVAAADDEFGGKSAWLSVKPASK
jgi:hypothetical protein